jgi:hypothetical protein
MRTEVTGRVTVLLGATCSFGLVVSAVSLVVGTGVAVFDAAAARPTARAQFRSVAFAGASDGIVADVVSSPTRHCEIELYRTTDAGAHWSTPLSLSSSACDTPPLATLNDAGRFWLAAGDRLYEGGLASAAVPLRPQGAGETDRLLHSPGAWCSLVAGANSLWATAGQNCDVVLRSLDGGRHWSTPASFPLARLDRGLVSHPSPIAVDGGHDLVAIGWPPGASRLENPDVVRSGNDGASWQLTRLGCTPPEGWFGGLLAASGQTVVVACLSQGAAAMRAMEIFVSTDGRRSFDERCGNGLLEISNDLGSCQFVGEPESLGVLDSGVLVLSIGAASVFLDASSDLIQTSLTRTVVGATLAAAKPMCWDVVVCLGTSRVKELNVGCQSAGAIPHPRITPIAIHMQVFGLLVQGPLVSASSSSSLS